MTEPSTTAPEPVAPPVGEPEPPEPETFGAGPTDPETDLPPDPEADLPPEPPPADLSPQPSLAAAPPRPEIPSLDSGAIRAARAGVRDDPRPGRLGETVVWAAGVQGASPPRPFALPALLVVVGRGSDGEVAGRAAALLAAPPDGVRLRVVGADLPPTGPIGTADACSRDDAVRAFALGRFAVDREVDAGADLLLVGDAGVSGGAAVATLAALLTGAEPVACVGRDGDAATWARTVAVVRDARRRGRALLGHPMALLAAVGGPDLAALTGVLVQAAVRRTPVLLDAPAAAVCGVLAERYADGTSMWWIAADCGADPAQRRALAELGLDPLLDVCLGYDGGRGALLALPVLQGALGYLGTAAVPDRVTDTELAVPAG